MSFDTVIPAGVPIEGFLYELWFDDNFAAHDALLEIQKIPGITEMPVYIKPMMGMERGWGFKDFEQGFIAKCAVGG